MDQRRARPGLISIALCTRNGALHLAAQVESLLAQSYPDIEIIASDDASDDETPEILRHFAARDTRLSVQSHATAQGFNQNFASTLARCRGGYIAPCDQDDVWHADKLKILRAAIGDADAVYCDSAYIDGAGRLLGQRLSDGRAMYAGQDPLALALANSASGHASLYTKALTQRAVPFPDGVFYDWWLAFNAAAGRGLAYVDLPLVSFRRHAETVTTLGAPERHARPLREQLAQRQRLLHAMATIPTARQRELSALAAALDQGLESGYWWSFTRIVWRHRRPLGWILRQRVPSVLRRLLWPKAPAPAA